MGAGLVAQGPDGTRLPSGRHGAPADPARVGVDAPHHRSPSKCRGVMMVVYEVPAHMSHSQSSNLLGEYCGAAYWYGRVLGKPERPGWAMLGGSALHEASETWDWGLINEGLSD